MEYFGLLVIGRNEAFHPREIRRFAWRQAYTKVDSKPIYCRTFDQLYEDLERRLNGDLLSAEVSRSARAGARKTKKKRRS